MDILYDHLGGNELYTKDEWEEIKKSSYDLVERDTDREADTTVYAFNKSYNYVGDLIHRIALKDIDFVLEMRDHKTGATIARATMGVHGKNVCVVRDKNSVYKIY